MMLSGSDRLLDTAISASAYEKVLSILGDTGVILPLGDPLLSKLDGTTFTTVQRTSSGIEATFTWSEAPNDFDVKPTTKGIVPVITFNGTDEEADSPDTDYWTFGDGSSDEAVSMGAWVRVRSDASGSGVILSKTDNTTGSTQKEWNMAVGSSGNLNVAFRDDSAGGRIEETANTAIGTERWGFVVFTYSGNGSTSGLLLYVNGSHATTSNGSAGSYTAMENKDAKLMLGHWIDSSGNPAVFLDGDLAGGPVGPFVVNKELTASEVKRLYHIGRRLLELP